MATENPLGFLRIARAEIEFPADTSPYDECVYRKARENYAWLRREAPLVQDEQAHFYIYALEMDGSRQVGVVAAAAVDDYDHGLIKRHEKTRQDKEDDRTRHILALRSQTGPVFITYRDAAEIDKLVAQASAEPPLFDFVAHAGIRHTGWRVPQLLTTRVMAAFEKVDSMYIADGHHRAASASRARAILRDKARQTHTTRREYDGFLAVLFPASQMHILPYNRLVRDLNGLSPDMLLARLRSVFEVTETAVPAPTGPGHMHMYLEGRWWMLRFAGRTDCLAPVASLDVSLLQELVLGPVLGIYDPRTDTRLDFVGGIKGTDELVRAVDSGAAALAFSMYPTHIEQLMAIADNGDIMPPKSTWFEPKLRDGLFIHDI